jgi:hypothetical protein
VDRARTPSSCVEKIGEEMTCIRFDFEPDLPPGKQDAFLENINKFWAAVEKSERLIAHTDDANLRRCCYLKLKPGQGGIEMTARNLAASLRATPFISRAFVVDEGWPVAD